MTKLIILIRNFANAPTNCIVLFVYSVTLLWDYASDAASLRGPASLHRIIGEWIQSVTGKGKSKRVSETTPNATLPIRNPEIDPGSPETTPWTMAHSKETPLHLSHHICPSVPCQNITIGSNVEAEYCAINEMFTLGSWQQASWSPPLPDGTWLAAIGYDVTLFGVVSYK